MSALLKFSFELRNTFLVVSMSESDENALNHAYKSGHVSKLMREGVHKEEPASKVGQKVVKSYLD
jgi:hypothetical protein